jgi:hypothetical protein
MLYCCLRMISNGRVEKKISLRKKIPKEQSESVYRKVESDILTI